jgi:hypothetical protein
MAGEPDKHCNIAEAVQDSRLCRLFSYWLAKKGDRRCPSRGDIDPLDFAYVLGHVILFDVIRDPLRFRVRVHGTEMVRRARYDLTASSSMICRSPTIDGMCASGAKVWFGMANRFSSTTIGHSTVALVDTRRFGCPSQMMVRTLRCCLRR